MAIELPVTDDSKHLTVTYTYFDSKGTEVTDPAKIPVNPMAVYAVSDPAAVTVDPSSGALTPVSVSAGVSASVTNPDGSALSDPAGVIAFTVVPVVFDIVAGPITAGTATVGIA